MQCALLGGRSSGLARSSAQHHRPYLLPHVPASAELTAENAAGIAEWRLVTAASDDEGLDLSAAPASEGGGGGQRKRRRSGPKSSSSPYLGVTQASAGAGGGEGALSSPQRDA